ncbi:hypothetical protein BaRGS_00012986, partial [Batillaria attramentaria]
DFANENQAGQTKHTRGCYSVPHSTDKGSAFGLQEVTGRLNGSEPLRLLQIIRGWPTR